MLVRRREDELKRVAVVQIGYGTVGGAVIDQVLTHRPAWRDTLGLDVRIAAVAGRSGAVAMESGAELGDAELRHLVAMRHGSRSPRAHLPQGEIVEQLGSTDAVIVIDAAAGEETADTLVDALERGVGVVLSNKAPLALPGADPRSQVLWSEAGPGGRLRYEATCGAGLPVISTLRTLLDTGDTVLEVTGALSGTFGAIFSAVGAGQPFAAAVREARDNGYTEPDPRDDLSGLDVARKALILARTLGRRIDLSAITIHSLVPKHLVDVSVPEFLERLVEMDLEIASMARDAAGAGSSLKFVASLAQDGTVSVGLRHIPRTTVLGALQGPENIVSFRTRRYDRYPTVVSGPGAGADVTAAGMLGDALALARMM
jgi:homoserine dehydrogenase